MKLYFKSILAINVSMLLLCVVTSVIANDIFVKILSGLMSIFWYASLYTQIKNHINDEKQSLLNEFEQDKKKKKRIKMYLAQNQSIPN